MPVLERDPWRMQYFEHVPCPDDVLIPTDDPDCWMLYPRHRWIYDKLKIAESQHLPCGPHGVMPETYPVFSKPLINLKGMGVGSRVIRNPADMEHYSLPGHMWMELLRGTHVSTDCAIVDGRIVWSRHASGVPWTEAMFKHWTVHADPLPHLDDYLSDWVGNRMAGYYGMMNFETIGGRIIEAHLRFADQWCDLYGGGWVKALVRLYEHREWNFPDAMRSDGYSVPLFAGHGRHFRHPPEELQQKIRAMPHINSLQITFHESKSAGVHAMPPGGFRLAVINADDLAAGFAARLELATAFSGEAILPAD